MQSQFSKREEEILAYWDKKKIFEKSLKARKDGPRFVFYEGPPTANGRPHIGHVISRCFKDLFPRYKTMQGFYVERKAGWDTHGIPVELEVEKELGFSGKKDIEEYGVGKFNKKCQENVWKYLEEWERFTKRMAFWLDLDNPYVTYKNDYIESLWWIIKQWWDHGYLYQDYKVVPHCPRCGTALSSHEVAQGYKDVTEPSVYVKFKSKADTNTYFLAWTTTPWTLPGNVALAVGDKITYVKVRQGEENYILAKDRLEILEGEYELIKEVKGKDLVGQEYEPLYKVDVPKGKKAYYVTDADFVSTEDGTGIVHTAVMYGEDDFQLGNKLDLPKVHTVNQDGNYNSLVPQWKGQFVKDVDPKIIKDLDKRRLLYKAEDYTHSYPFCWRCKTPLLYYAKQSWFVKVSEVRNQLIKNNQSINWVPDYLKDGRFGKWLEGARDWAFSRERYWGTPLPIWICKECDVKRCVGSIKELAEGGTPRDEEGEVDLHRPFIDEITLPCTCGSKLHRVPDVVDVWFDSGAMPFAQWHYPFENKDKIDSGDAYPADFICEAIDQTRGWFYTLLTVSTLLSKGHSYKNVISLGHIRDKEGKKMSKSVGNVVDPWRQFEQYGADAVRWYLYTINQPGEPKNYDEESVEEIVKKLFLIFSNVVRFYEMVSQDKAAPKAVKTDNVLDRWILSKLNQLVKDVTEDLNGYHVIEAARDIAEFINDLSTWYVRRNRSRAKSDGKEAEDFRATLAQTIETLTYLLAPFTPFFAEHVYLKIQELHKTKGKDSVHLVDWPKADTKQIDKDLIGVMERVRKIVESAHALRADAKQKVRQPLAKLEIKGVKLTDDLVAIMIDELNVREIVFVDKLNTTKGWVNKDEPGFSLSLDINLTVELKEEGMVRDIVRHVNNLRKNARLTPQDIIDLSFDTSDKKAIEVITKYSETISRETHAKSITNNKEAGEQESTVKIDGTPLWLSLKKV